MVSGAISTSVSPVLGSTSKDGHLGDDAVGAVGAGQRQMALAQNLGLAALGGVHHDHNAAAGRNQIHRAAQRRYKLNVIKKKRKPR